MAAPTPPPVPTPPPALPAPTQETAMGSFLAILLSFAEKFVADNLPSIEQTVLTDIEKAAESLFSNVNKANPATPDKTVVAAPPK